MRQGQAVCDYVTLPSDKEIRLCIVPLTEAEYTQALNKVLELEAQDNLAGMAMRDRVQSQEILVRAIREETDLTQRVYQGYVNEKEHFVDAVDEMMESLDVNDIDELIDRYNEMMESSSPSLDGIPPKEWDELKKLLETMDWNALSGSAWYAAKRFLSRISPSPLLDNSLGSTSTNSLTTTSD
jgi:hypothetical protein